MSPGYTLITGATGFIGSHVAEKLLRDKSWPVIAIAREGRGYKNTAELEREGALLVQGRFYDPDLLQRVFTQFPIRNVVHIAALTGEGKGRQKDYEEINVQGTENLLDASHRYGVDKFIYCSSVGVFGTIPEKTPADLQTRLKPDNLYHRSKLNAEKRVHEFISKGLNAFIIRPTIAYGQGDTGFPFRLVKMVKTRVLLLPFRDNRIHLVSVSSLADMFLRLLKIDILHNRVFIAADEDPVVLREMVNLIHSFYFGKDYPPFLVLPSSVLEGIEAIFRMIRHRGWVGKIQRVSKEWSFDTHKTDSLIRFRPANTQKEFLKYLCSLK